jgi:hypothetical protein
VPAEGDEEASGRPLALLPAGPGAPPSTQAVWSPLGRRPAGQGVHARPTGETREAGQGAHAPVLASREKPGGQAVGGVFLVLLFCFVWGEGVFSCRRARSASVSANGRLRFSTVSQRTTHASRHLLTFASLGLGRRRRA